MLVAGFGFRGFWCELRIFENTPPGFFTQPSRFYVLHQKWSRPELFAQGLMQVFEDAQPGIEPHQIDEFEWTHGMI